MKKATIYHNPKCSKSRGALAILEERGFNTEVILYLDTPPSRDTLSQLLTEMGMSARDLLRTNEEPYKTLNLADEKLSEQQLIQAMVENPVLINRPIVQTEFGTKLGRPLENIECILSNNRDK
ncbi:arsenate reductase (glutaredoxin) [Pasteurella skyensis]|uniref:Arsenate reductase n=1 Tax=Phocoenobacter skyensis TaxID=97481 RepID=A0AAJ6NDK4_9PAST|nr:arsenate reductase (glutaredoxin) [Pasteurella skyensis]MDP8170670.1 arsenate reductase (glutaredoxin) [Pasteurella skyensis]MDP8174849.1 arsenate reductase (glutaredoxin) [Pasteurella skyensis]